MKKKLLLFLVIFALSFGIVAPAKAGWFADLYTKIKKIFTSEEKLGFSVVTDYQKTLRISMTAAQDFVPVTSLTLKDDTVLDMTKFGDKVFLTIEPGKDKEEIVMCTGINTSSLNFTGCTRGLAFSGTSTAAVAGLAKTHSAGSNVTISNAHYVYQEFVDLDTTQTITGAKTFTGVTTLSNSTTYIGDSLYVGDNTTAYNKTVFARNGAVSSPYLRYNEGLAMWQWSANGSDVYNFTSSTFTVLTASSTKGIEIIDSKIAINASSTTGMSFDSNGALYQKTQTATGVESDSNGIKINTTTLTNLIATTTPTAGMIPIASSTGKINDNWLNDTVFSHHYVVASDILLISSDATTTHNTTDYTKKKSIRVFLYGTYRISFDVKQDTGTNFGNARIYKNGVAFGTERTLSSSFQTFSEDLIFSPWDTVEIYLKRGANAGDIVSLKNFRIYGTDTLSTDYGIKVLE